VSTCFVKHFEQREDLINSFTGYNLTYGKCELTSNFPLATLDPTTVPPSSSFKPTILASFTPSLTPTGAPSLLTTVAPSCMLVASTLQPSASPSFRHTLSTVSPTNSLPTPSHKPSRVPITRRHTSSPDC
jgi:hypothetical protein